MSSKYGRYSVIGSLGKINGHVYLKCRCDCGTEKSVRKHHLTSGKIVSCGCYVFELNTEGRTGVVGKVTGTKLRNSWLGMKARCYDEKNISYPHYGGKGVSVCLEWLYSYKLFREWSLLNGYSEGLSIDRIDTNKGYNPSNCRWVTKAENNLEMIERHYSKGTGTFSKETIEKLTNINRDGLGVKFEMFLDGTLVSEYRCLLECAQYIVILKGLSTEPKQVKKNISACLNGNRNKCHGFTFRRIMC